MNIPIILKFESLYIEWQIILISLPKVYKYSIGNTLDRYFLASLENIYTSLQEENIDKKILLIKKANSQIDIIKFLLNISFQNKSISSGQLKMLIEKLLVIGRILGGWKKSLLDKQLKTKNT